MKLLPQVLVQQGALQGTVVTPLDQPQQEVITSLWLEGQMEEAVRADER